MRSIYFTLLVFILALPGGFCHASDDDFEDDYEDALESQLEDQLGTIGESNGSGGEFDDDEFEDELEERLEARLEKAEDFDDDLEDRLEDMFDKHHKMDDDFEDDLEDHMEDRLERMERNFPDELDSLHQLAELDERLDDLEILSVPDEYIELMDDEALERALEAGAEVRSVEKLDGLGQLLVTFSEERTESAELNHVYTLDAEASVNQSAADSNGMSPSDAARLMGMYSRPQQILRIGMMDSSVKADHECFAGTDVYQQAFYPKGANPDYRHGTAMASVFTAECGLLDNAVIYNAEVFGRTAKGLVIASAADLIRGLNWLIGKEPDVVSLSLSGPPNRVLSSALEAVLAQGIRIVASVGNEGPAAYPRYPAAQPGVIAVTAVDQALEIYTRAVQGNHVHFSAPGVGIRLADSSGGLVSKDGTSVAAAIAAATLATAVSITDLEASAQDLGKPGFDSVFGFGLLNLDSNVATSAE